MAPPPLSRSERVASKGSAGCWHRSVGVLRGPMPLRSKRELLALVVSKAVASTPLQEPNKTSRDASVRPLRFVFVRLQRHAHAAV